MAKRYSLLAGREIEVPDEPAIPEIEKRSDAPSQADFTAAAAAIAQAKILASAAATLEELNVTRSLVENLKQQLADRPKALPFATSFYVKRDPRTQKISALIAADGTPAGAMKPTVRVTRRDVAGRITAVRVDLAAA
jgi:hypothetical protein